MMDPLNYLLVVMQMVTLYSCRHTNKYNQKFVLWESENIP